MTKEELEKEIYSMNKDIRKEIEQEQKNLEEQTNRLKKLLPKMQEDAEMFKMIALTFNKIRDNLDMPFVYTPIENDEGMKFMAIEQQNEKTKEKEIKVYITQTHTSFFNISFKEEFYATSSCCLAFYPSKSYFLEIDTENKLSHKVTLNSFTIESFCLNYENLHKQFHEWLDTGKMGGDYRIAKYRFFNSCKLKNRENI